MNEKMKEKLQLQMKELYSLGRSRLVQTNLQLFTLPCRQIQKQGIGGMKTWNAMAEMEYQKIPNFEELYGEIWMHPMTAIWKESFGMIEMNTGESE